MSSYEVALKKLVKSGFKQGQIAGLFHVAPSTVSGWMKGNRPTKAHRKMFKEIIAKAKNNSPLTLNVEKVNEIFKSIGGDGRDGELKITKDKEVKPIQYIELVEEDNEQIRQLKEVLHSNLSNKLKIAFIKKLI